MKKPVRIALWIGAVTVPLVVVFWAGTVFGEIMAESKQKLFFMFAGREDPARADRSLGYFHARQYHVWLSAVWRRIHTEVPKPVAEWLFALMRSVESPSGVELLSELCTEIGADASRYDGASRQLLREMIRQRAASPSFATDVKLDRYFALLGAAGGTPVL